MSTEQSEKPIVVVGSINMDLVATVEHIPLAGETLHSTGFSTYPGGKGANQAVAVARLGYPVEMIGMLGNDGFAGSLREGLARDGVGVHAVGEWDGPSGTALIAVAGSGENSIIVNHGANAQVTPQVLERNGDLIRNAGAVLTQLEIPLETVACLANLCREFAVPLILDPAPAARLPDEVFAGITWITPNETEAEFYAGKGDTPALAERLLARGVSGAVLKQGARGAYLATQGAWSATVNAFPVNAVDTTAAGDAFNGAFAVGLMLGMTPEEAARFAAAAAAVSVTRRGAQTSMPTRAEVDRLLGK